MRFWLLDLPALLVTLWFRAYYVVLAGATMIVMTLLALSGLLWVFGIRWGY